MKRIIGLFLALMVTALSAAIEVDGIDLDWARIKSERMKEFSDPKRKNEYLKDGLWLVDKDQLYFLFRFGKGMETAMYEVVLNLDFNYDDIADICISIDRAGNSRISQVTRAGDLKNTRSLHEEKKIRAEIDSSAEFRFSVKDYPRQFRVSAGIWDPIRKEALTMTLWHPVDTRPLEKKLNPAMIRAALKNFTGKKNKIPFNKKVSLTMDGNIKDWALLESRYLGDSEEGLYYHSSDLIYFLFKKPDFEFKDNHSYYALIDSDQNGKKNFWIAIHADGTSTIHFKNTVYQAEDYEGFAGGFGDFVEFSIPLPLFRNKKAQVSFGLMNDDNGEVLYYTDYLQFVVSPLNQFQTETTTTTVREASASTSSTTTTTTTIPEEVISDRSESGLTELLNKLTDEETKALLRQFALKGIEEELDLHGASGQAIADHSSNFLNIPYVYAQADKSGTDCSGMTYQIFRDFQVALPRGAGDQGRMGTVIPSIEALQPGDLVFFIRTYKTSGFITHVGLYLGNGKFINANSYAGKTKIDDIHMDYWRTKFIFGTRGKTGSVSENNEITE